MCAAVNNAAGIEYQDLVGIANGCHALGDDYAGHRLLTLSEGSLHCGAYLGVGSHVQRGKGIIKEVNQRAGN